MPWADQQPEATDILIASRAPGSSTVHFEIDLMDNGNYRATAGDLFGSQEIIRDSSLDKVLRKVAAIKFRK